MAKIEAVEERISVYQARDKLAKEKAGAEDDLDEFMTNLSTDKPLDKMEIRKLRVRTKKKQEK